MNRILILLLVIGTPCFTIAQDIEVGLMFGASTYSGDLNPGGGRFSTADKSASFGIFVRRDLNKYVAGRAGLLFGKIAASDSATDLNRARNLSFQSSLMEFSGVFEFNPLGTNSTQKRFKPYLYGGLAVFRFNPKTNYNGQLVALQPLGTEGQGMEGFGSRYRRTQISIPIGIGFKYQITDKLHLGLDLGLRKTFTDYLDDVSGSYVNYNDLLAGNGQLAAALGNRQGELIGNGEEPVIVPTGTQRGNPDRTDWYHNIAVTLSYTLFGGNDLSGKDFGCPVY